jgi:branched-chain amino acid transport system ATP-binding protein
VNPVLQVHGLNGGYTRAPVLRDVELHVLPGEIVAVLGANGAGKTTLLRALSGTLPICHGEIQLGDRALGRLPSWDRVKAGLVHVPEGRRIFRAMTVRENLDVAGIVSRGRVPHDEVYDLFPRLAERANQPGGSLSGGEQQMLAIGRALMTAPSVLMIDEMSAGLAPVLVQQLVEGLVQLRSCDTAALLVEQSPHFIADFVDRVYLLEHGAIVDSGSLAALGGADRIADLYLGVS